MTTDRFSFYFQNRLIQTSQVGGQWYSDTSPLSIPWIIPFILSRLELIRNCLPFGHSNLGLLRFSRFIGITFGPICPTKRRRDIHGKGTQHNDTQHSNKVEMLRINHTQHKNSGASGVIMLRVILNNVIMLRVVFFIVMLGPSIQNVVMLSVTKGCLFEHRVYIFVLGVPFYCYAECRYAECHYTEWSLC
jgi:hypothetical protein